MQVGEYMPIKWTMTTNANMGDIKFMKIPELNTDINQTPKQAMNLLNPIAKLIIKIRTWYQLWRLKNAK